MLGGSPRFVLSTSAHIQALIHPPSPDSRSSYDQWLAERSGELKPAPKRLGNAKYKAHAKAPGTFVHAS
jgi:polyhydroxyalkanoate synthase